MRNLLKNGGDSVIAYTLAKFFVINIKGRNKYFLCSSVVWGCLFNNGLCIWIILVEPEENVVDFQWFLESKFVIDP